MTLPPHPRMLPHAMTSLLEIDQVECRFDGPPVVNKVSLKISRGEVVSLLGPSGCGKTTLLRAIAGFVSVTGGAIRLEERLISSPETHLAPEERRIGMVFQDYALFPHLTVGGNVAFGLEGRSETDRTASVTEILTLVGLEGLAERFPHELSGGQQQRVALARALAPEPDLLLMDEPFSNLDVEMREKLSLEVRQILKSRNATAILVTHDQHEAFAMGEKVAVIHEGAVQQWDTPWALYHEPANRFVADFIGQGAFLPGTVLDHDRIDTELGVLQGNRPGPWTPGDAVDVLIRPDDITHLDDAPHRAIVAAKAFKGAEILYTLELPSGCRMLSLFPSHHDHAIGEEVGFVLTQDHLVAFSPRSTPNDGS